MEYVEALSGIYMVVLAFMFNTYNARAAILFQAIPVLGGVALLFDSLSRLGWI